jgi:hypothetical protein
MPIERQNISLQAPVGGKANQNTLETTCTASNYKPISKMANGQYQALLWTPNPDTPCFLWNSSLKPLCFHSDAAIEKAAIVII